MPNHRGSRSRHLDSPAAFGKRLREQRERAGLTLRQLSFEGCTAPYISAIEHGRRVPSLQVVQQLAERLGVSAEWLATGREDRSEALLLDAELALRLGDNESAEVQLTALAADEVSQPIRARAHAGLGEIKFHAGDIQAAISEFRTALELAPQAGPEFASAVELLGRSYALRGEHESAVTVFSVARQRALERGDRVAALRFSVLLANAYVDIGDLAGSASAISESLQDSAELSDPTLRARVEWTQSRLHTVEGRHDLAAEFAQRAIATLRVSEDDHAVARAQQMLAYIEIERGQPDEALELLNAAAPTIARLGGAVERATLELERARALLALGRKDEARAVALDVMPTLVENAKSNGGRGFVVLGEVLDASGEAEAALNMFDAAIETLKGHRSPHLTRAYQCKAAALERLGRRDEAFEAMKSALEAQQTASARS